MTGRVQSPRRKSGVVLLAGQVRYQNKLYWRTPVATFFTMTLPLLLLIVLVTVFGDDPFFLLGIPTVQFYAPSLAVFGAVSASYMYLAVSTAILRDVRILKRFRGTPLPTWIYLAGRIISAGWLAIVAVIIMLAVGMIFYDLEIIGATLPAAALTLVVGIVSFAALGMMVATMVGTGDAAQAVANSTLLPLAFISDIFLMPVGTMPDWLEDFADFFPLKHFSTAFGQAFDPRYSGNGFQWSAGPQEYAIFSHLAVMLAWGALGLLVAVRFFRWEPQEGGRSALRRWLKVR